MRRFKKRSAVAMILQVRGGELHILMIKRAEREGDPWSGHMARSSATLGLAFRSVAAWEDEFIGTR